MTEVEIKTVLKEYLQKKIADQNMSLAFDTQLIVSGLLDSLAILDLIEHVEELFNLKLTDDEMIPEHFNSITTLASLIEKKLLA